MTVLRKEDGELARLHRDVGLGQSGIERDVLLGIVLGLGQCGAGRVAHRLGHVERNLDVNHPVVRLDAGLFPGLALADVVVDEEVGALNLNLAWFVGTEVVLLNVRHDLGEERIQRGILAEVFNGVDNHSTIIENGELKIENGELKIENGELKIENGELKTENWELKLLLSFGPLPS